MKKVFIVSGELSGDLLGGWYVRKHYAHQQVYIEALGGDHLQQAGAHLYERFEKLNVTGIVEIIKHIPRLLKFLNQLAAYIIEQQFNEVVVIDFPGFNMRLIKRLKRLCSTITVTYFSPPQLWCWGAWRVASLKKYCDKIIVLYPFEVEWYAQRGVHVQWIGCPVYDRMQQYFEKSATKKHLIALVPGSRLSEIKTLLPIFARVASALKLIYPDIQFIIPQAASISSDQLSCALKRSGLDKIGKDLIIVRDSDEKWQQLAHCSMALTKPGTVTLELALLKIPALVIFRVSWITYWLARIVVKVRFMALPNLLSGQEVYKEFIQHFSIDTVVYEAQRLNESSIARDAPYAQMVEKLERLSKSLEK
ncbi:lipid-A-disaccharide synthase [Candidatus Dependentiae bacterium]|jgi:lipid-A-disaccharide synthase|nr:lipid-A-disaccharide synthase [Candidatus Dependentiae bacterium]